ncbi:MAG: dihydrolipoamide acetyltransferase family protein, partial [Planctomycetota bacterium]|nr:dihydrolipoamide acetyltransferase family protein [Planctomycetota bacterium]
MAVLIKVPRLGWSMDEGTFGEWLQGEGATVKPGDLLFTLEGDKSSQDIESFDSGKLHIPETAPQPGDPVRVGQPLAFLLATDEKPMPLPQFDAQPQDAFQTTSEVSNRVAGPASRRLAREMGIDLQNVPTPDPKGRVTREDLQRLQTKPLPSPTNRPYRKTSTPRARRTAQALGIDIRHVKGSGTNGRVRERDLQQLPPDRHAVELVPQAEGTWQEPEKMRMVIARRLSASFNDCVPVTLNTKINAGNLVKFRESLTSGSSEDQPLPSLNDILLWVTAQTLAENPTLNCCWINDQLYQYGPINIAFAMDTEHGLCTPVIKEAHQKTLGEIATVSKQLIQKARQNPLSESEISGGTFTVSNLGMYGIDHFTPIINLRQAAILGIGRILNEPVIENGKLKPGTTLAL